MDRVNSQLAVVIPAYNEGQTIRKLVQQVLSHVAQVVVVDDGSQDNTCAEIQDLPITLVKHASNQGKGIALLTGFQALANKTDLAAIVTLDGDGQHDPRDLSRFASTQQQYSQHIIIGARLIREQKPPRHRLFGNQVADFFIGWATGQRIVDSQSGYRLYPKAFIQQYLAKSHRFTSFAFDSKILIDAIRQGYPAIAVKIKSHYPVNARASHYRPVIDSCKISLLVFYKIVSRGLCLHRLWRSLTTKALVVERED